MHAAIMPVKSPERAKSRLGPRFGPAERRAIADALFGDALSLCVEVDLLRWWVISDDSTVLERAGAAGLGALRDGGVGVNEAVAVGIEAALQASAESVTIFPADLPLASPEDLIDVLDSGELSDVVLVPARTGGGTNVLHIRPPGAIPPAFGAGSLAAHVRAADELGLRCTILPLAGLELDIDTPADVDAFRAAGAGAGTRTRALLAGLG